MFARVIPLVRTPLGVEGFDYVIPKTEEIEVGDLVWIPFRRGRCVGLVTACFKDSAFAARALSIERRYANIRLPIALPDLISWTAKRTFSSSPTVLSSWLRALPKRPQEQYIRQKHSKKTGLQALWTANPTEHLLAHARKSSSQGRVLIVTPWITLAKQLHEALPSSHILHSDMPDGEAFQQWTQFLSKDTGCLITTKIGAWLATASDLVLLHEPEQDDHKQDESTPRYDARRVLLWCAEHSLTEVQSYGLTPPLHSEKEAPALEAPLVHIHHPQGRSKIRMLQADSVQALLDHSGSRIIIHSISGSLSRLICRDCNWQAACPACTSGLGADHGQALCRVCRKRSTMPDHCPVCGGVDLSKSLPGIDRLQTEWQTQFPDSPVEWRTLTAETLEAPLPTGCLVVVTDAAWISVGEDIRKRERQCIALRRLIDRVSNVQGTLILQCQETFASLLSDWLTVDGMKRFVQDTCEERHTFEYPPSKRVVKMIFHGEEATAEEARYKIDQALRTHYAWDIHWRGPMPIQHQNVTRGKRMIVHAVFPPGTPEQTLIEAFTPYAKEATIDLDPIAFLR